MGSSSLTRMRVAAIVILALCGTAVTKTVPEEDRQLSNLGALTGVLGGGNGLAGLFGGGAAPGGALPSNLLGGLTGATGANPLSNLLGLLGNNGATGGSSNLLDGATGKGGKGKSGKGGILSNLGNFGKGGKGGKGGILSNLGNLGKGGKGKGGKGNIFSGLFGGRSLDRHGKGKGKGKDGKGGKGKDGKGGKGKDGKGGNALTDGLGGVLSALSGGDLLSQVLSTLVSFAGAVAAGTAALSAISTIFPTTTVTKAATIPNPTTDLLGFLTSQPITDLIQGLINGDLATVFSAITTLAGSLILQMITGAISA